MGETAAAAGPVYVGRFIDFLRDRHPAGEEGQSPERHPFPDIGDDVRSEGEPAVIEPERTVNTEQRRQDAIDQTLLANQHPVEGDKGRNRRERPGQNVDWIWAVPALVGEGRVRGTGYRVKSRKPLPSFARRSRSNAGVQGSPCWV